LLRAALKRRHVSFSTAIDAASPMRASWPAKAL
jgi:hypothetical protein